MSSPRATLLTPEEYLEIERRAERKSEYYKGEMFALAGASRKHVLVSPVEYVTIAQDRPHVEQWTRQETSWSLVEYSDLSVTIQLGSVGAGLPLSEIYDKVDFDR